MLAAPDPGSSNLTRVVLNADGQTKNLFKVPQQKTAQGVHSEFL